MWSNRISSITDVASVKLGHLSAITGKEDTMQTTFVDRKDAGRQLGQSLGEHDGDIDAVIALQGGGVPVGHEVADHLDVPLYCLVVRPIQSPFNPERAIGAVTSTGDEWLDEEHISEQELGDRYIDDGIRVEHEQASDQQDLYGDVPADLSGMSVAIIDDGIETEATIRAALKQLGERGATPVIAAPVIPRTLYDRFADDTSTIAVTTPETFVSTGQHYKEFKPLTDEEESSYLNT